MNNKEVEKIICNVCESNYKLVYEVSETSGYAKFCPFCGELNTGEDYVENELDKEE